MSTTVSSAPSPSTPSPSAQAASAAVEAGAPRAVGLSESAARRIKALAAKEGDGYFLRLSVSGGGCSGFQYGFSFDDAMTSDDHAFERDGARLVVDEVSLDLLAGAELDFVEEMMGAYFKVQNPNASSSCGCGASFAV